MAKSQYFDELQRALARPDSGNLCAQVDAYAANYKQNENCDYSDEYADVFYEITDSYNQDPEKALAYIVLAAARSDSEGFISFMACGPLEDVLSKPSPDLLERIADEARKSARFRWMLNHPFKTAISTEAWKAIEKFRIPRPHEEPLPETMPP